MATKKYSNHFIHFGTTIVRSFTLLARAISSRNAGERERERKSVAHIRERRLHAQSENENIIGKENIGEIETSSVYMQHRAHSAYMLSSNNKLIDKLIHSRLIESCFRGAMRRGQQTIQKATNKH